jgi:hypothetical protein
MAHRRGKKYGGCIGRQVPSHSMIVRGLVPKDRADNSEPAEHSPEAIRCTETAMRRAAERIREAGINRVHDGKLSVLGHR